MENPKRGENNVQFKEIAEKQKEGKNRMEYIFLIPLAMLSLV